MFRILVDRQYDNEKRYIEAACNSDDTLPEENFVTGSSCLITDEKKIKFFDEDAAAGEKWR